MKTIPTNIYSTSIQLKLPVDLGRKIKITDPIYTFNGIMEQIDLRKYFAGKESKKGRKRFDREKLFKIVMFAFMEFGYCTIRQIEKLCETDIRFMWILDGEEAPSHMTIDNFIKDELSGSVEEIFTEITSVISKEMSVDMNHAYIDGTKTEANAQKYTWVWKKSCIRSRGNVFFKLNGYLKEMNETVFSKYGVSMELRQEYSIEYIEYVLREYLHHAGLTTDEFVHGSGRRKSEEQKLYERTWECLKKLKEYSEHIRICGEKRNSYSKTDHDATFFRMKRDYMGNGQLLPGYNIQTVICDEFIAEYGVFPYASDSDCFKPLMERFHSRWGAYPEYPVADAGYGSFNNYLYCEEHGMKKYMKFTMYEKESKDRGYRDDPFRACNFPIDSDGHMVCPNGKRFHFLKTSPIRGNEYGRTEEYYRCEDCIGCTYRDRCHKSKENRIVRINTELTSIHKEVLSNLNSTHGALLRMNRSIQAEGVYGEIKWNRGYRRIHRRGINNVILELGLISCGFNLHKYHLKRSALANAA